MIIGAGFLWGMLGIFVRSLDAFGFTSLEITCLRSLVTCLLLFFFLIRYDKKQFQIHKNDLWMFAGSGIISIAFFSFCYLKQSRSHLSPWLLYCYIQCLYSPFYLKK